MLQLSDRNIRYADHQQGEDPSPGYTCNGDNWLRLVSLRPSLFVDLLFLALDELQFALRRLGVGQMRLC